jgi:hypothetical protein
LALLLISLLSSPADAAPAPGHGSATSASGSAAQAEAEPSLGAFLDAEGRLQLPPGFSGSVNPAGYRIVSGEGEALRFAPEEATSDGSGWNGYGNVADGCHGIVRALAIGAAGVVYVGGSFTLCGNASANNIARFDITTLTWASLGSGVANGVSGVVLAIAISGSSVYVGGDFTQAGGAPANRMARFDTASQTWASLGSGAANGVNNLVYALAISGSTVYVGGDLTQAGGALANRVARFDTGTQTWASLGNGAANGVDSTVWALAVSGSTVYAGGSFTQAGGIPANRIAKFDSVGQIWASLGSGATNGVNNTVLALAVSGTTVYAGGSFTEAGGATANRVARFDTSIQSWASFGTGPTNGVSSLVRALAVSGGTLYLSGDFTQAGGSLANRVARFDSNTETWASLGGGNANGLSGQAFALAVCGSAVCVGGGFLQAGGAPANRVARFDATAQTWAPLGGVSNGVNGRVRALTVTGSTVYLGGEFTQAGGLLANRVARFDTITQTWASLGSGTANGVNAGVYAIDFLGSTVYVGGFFNQAGGLFARSVASFDTTNQTWARLGSGAFDGVNGVVLELAVSGDKLFVGGSFTQAGGLLANQVARFDTITQTWASLGSDATNGVSGDTPSIGRLAVSGNSVFVGGRFTQAGGAPANNVARFDTSSQTWASLGSGVSNGVNGQVFALAVSGSTVFVGGIFTGAGGVSANYVARFDTSTQAWAPLGTGSANGVNSTVVDFTALGSTLYLVGNFTEAGGAPANYVARFDASTETWASLGSGAANGVNGGANAIAINGEGSVYVGGLFDRAGDQPSSNFASYREEQIFSNGFEPVTPR